MNYIQKMSKYYYQVIVVTDVQKRQIFCQSTIKFPFQLNLIKSNSKTKKKTPELIFSASTHMVNLLINNKQWFIDATYKITLHLFTKL